MEHYTTPAMRAVFDPRIRLQQWAHIEHAVLYAQAQRGLVPQDWCDKAASQAPPSVADWQAATSECGHEVVGFLRAWGLDHVHIGLTSSDLVDTNLALTLQRANRALLTEIERLHSRALTRATVLLEMPRVGRTHGVPAAPDTAGHWVLDLACGYRRVHARLQAAEWDLSVAKLSGPTGAYITPALTPQVERAAAEQLGLRPAPVASQIVLRDSLAQWAGVMAQIATLGEAMGNRIRAGARHGSVTEAHPSGREGSSAMPHKTNPTDSERLAGLARLARAAVAPITEGIAQWDDHDLAHSSVERVLVPQLAGLAAYSLVAAERLLTSQVQPEQHQPHQISSHATMTRLQLQGQPYEIARMDARLEPDEDAGSPVIDRWLQTINEQESSHP